MNLLNRYANNAEKEKYSLKALSYLLYYQITDASSGLNYLCVIVFDVDLLCCRTLNRYDK